MSKQIILKSLNMKNFKGIKELSIDFDLITNIYGDNGTGKTTIFDAFSWLLFDKDSKDRTAFEIKTLDSNGEAIHGLEHQVEGVLLVDGKSVALAKIFKEKWTKKKGEATRQLTGHETLYYINEIPVKQSEYKAKISGIIDETIFKLITNTTYFSLNLKWQDRRKAILDIIGDIDKDKIIAYNPELSSLEAILNDTDADSLKKSIAARKRKLNDDIKAIPVRVDECNNSIVEIDFKTLDFRKRNIESGIKSLEEQLIDNSKINDGYLEQKNLIYELKNKLSTIEFKARTEAQLPMKQLYEDLNKCSNEINKIESTVNMLTNNIQNMNMEISNIDKLLEALREEWSNINQSTLSINEEEFICPTCRRPLEEADVQAQKQKMLENFNQDKAKKLSEINSTGKTQKNKMEEIKVKLDKCYEELGLNKVMLGQLNKSKDELQQKIDRFDVEVNLSANLDSNKEYQEIKKQIADIESKLEKADSEPSNSSRIIEDVKQRKRNLEIDLEKVNQDLGKKEQNEQLEARIIELKKQEEKLAQKIAELEGQDYLCDKFIKTKFELLEKRINEKFKFVSFKLFNTLVNGAVEECCEALINGVPFSNANTASQINAGLDIINALGEHYKTWAPIFIDNRESVNQVISSNSQIINLRVSKDKTLSVENTEREVA